MALRDDILRVLRASPASLTAGEVANLANSTPQAVQPELHRLDDAGRVTMRNGWYRLTEAEKNRRAG